LEKSYLVDPEKPEIKDSLFILGYQSPRFFEKKV